MAIFFKRLRKNAYHKNCTHHRAGANYMSNSTAALEALFISFITSFLFININSTHLMIKSD
ncbi:hypothetical protein DYA88_07615 [Vibrio cholerae]|nr:hypothetical protein [Vibrio cholerae]RBM41022.1 hypothetical protein DLR62_06955 [Vibrio tarriae]